MRVAIDTNVLVRYLTWDDEKQARRAADIMEAASAILVCTVVLCETVWVLRRAYKIGHADIAASLRGMIAAAGVETDRLAAEAGLASLDQGGDFAEGVIRFEAGRARADQLATFDRGFAKDGATGKPAVIEIKRVDPLARVRPGWPRRGG